jgi:transposase-like protein
MKNERRRFTHEFKLEAVKLWKDSGRQSNAIAKQLGIMPQMLSRWHQTLGGQKTNPARCPTIQDPAAELAHLRKENARLKLEHEILKKPWPSSRRSPNDLYLGQTTP